MFTTSIAKRRHLIAFIPVAVAVAVTAGACANSSSSPAATSSGSLGASSSGGGALVAPIPISKAESITVKVGDTLNVITPNVTISTTNAHVLAISQAHSDGSAQFNPGARVIGPGHAELVVSGGITNGPLYTVGVTANPA